MADDPFNFEITAAIKPNVEDVNRNLREFAAEHVMTSRRKQDYQEWKGRRFHPHTLTKHFGTWQEILESAGIEYDKFSGVRTSREEVEANLRRFADLHSAGMRTAARFEQWPGRLVTIGAIKQFFPNWFAALSELGLECPTRSRSAKHSDEDYLRSTEIVWRWTVDTKRRSPRAADFKSYIATHTDGVSSGTLIRRFGPLTAFLEAFAAWKGGKLTRNELLSLKPGPQIRRIPFSKKLRYEILHAAGHKCALCGRGVDSNIVLHVDHIIPVSKGGTNEQANLRALCEDCNLGRSDRYLT